MKQVRQGDVLIESIDVVPNDASKMQQDPRGAVLAEGEATGHYHAIRNDNTVDMYQAANNKVFMKLLTTKELTHDEHDKIELPMGNYEVVRQREYVRGEIKTVLD